MNFLILAIIGIVALFIIHPPKRMMCDWLADKYGINSDAAMDADYNYIKGRYKAAKAGKEFFLVDGKKYATSNGRAI